MILGLGAEVRAEDAVEVLAALEAPTLAPAEHLERALEAAALWRAACGDRGWAHTRLEGLTRLAEARFTRAAALAEEEHGRAELRAAHADAVAAWRAARAEVAPARAEADRLALAHQGAASALDERWAHDDQIWRLWAQEGGGDPEAQRVFHALFLARADPRGARWPQPMPPLFDPALPARLADEADRLRARADAATQVAGDAQASVDAAYQRASATFDALGAHPREAADLGAQDLDPAEVHALADGAARHHAAVRAARDQLATFLTESPDGCPAEVREVLGAVVGPEPDAQALLAGYQARVDAFLTAPDSLRVGTWTASQIQALWLGAGGAAWLAGSPARADLFWIQAAAVGADPADHAFFLPLDGWLTGWSVALEGHRAEGGGRLVIHGEATVDGGAWPEDGLLAAGWHVVAHGDPGDPSAQVVLVETGKTSEVSWTTPHLAPPDPVLTSAPPPTPPASRRRPPVVPFVAGATGFAEGAGYGGVTVELGTPGPLALWAGGRLVVPFDPLALGDQRAAAWGSLVASVVRCSGWVCPSLGARVALAGTVWLGVGPELGAHVALGPVRARFTAGADLTARSGADWVSGGLELGLAPSRGTRSRPSIRD